MGARTFIALAMALGTSTPTDARSLADEGIRAVISGCIRSWNETDAAGIASAYERDGDFVSPDGVHAIGQSAIEAFYNSAFARGYAHSHGEFAIRNVRFPRPSFAIVDGVWQISKAHDQSGSARAPERGLAVAILRKHSGSWRIVALREQASATDLHEM